MSSKSIMLRCLIAVVALILFFILTNQASVAGKSK